MQERDLMGLRCAVAGMGATPILEHHKSGGTHTDYRSTSLVMLEHEVHFLES